MSEPLLRDYRPGSASNSDSQSQSQSHFEDWRAMHALDVQCFAPPFRFTRRAMRTFAETPGAITLLAEADSQLAAFGIAEVSRQPPHSKQAGSPQSVPQIEARNAYLVTLDVAPPWRRQGLARRLMHHLEVRAHAAGAETMALHVFSGNTAAVQLYESLGYQRTGTAANFYAPGLDALIYSKPLTH